MRCDLTKINTDQFLIRPCVTAGEPCVLVEPTEAGVPKWNRDNLIFRSSMWTADGSRLVSAGLPKFFNWDEDLDKDGKFVPGKIPYAKPARFEEGSIFDKMDGSQLIVSWFNGELIVRTRGTFAAMGKLSNAHELPGLIQSHGIKGFAQMHSSHSWIFEWFSPLNKIVLNYGDEPKLWLIGAVHNDDYSLMKQSSLDWHAQQMGWARPTRYHFKSLEELRAAINALEGREGVCFYFNNDQNILKLKSTRYLKLHYYKGDVSTFDKVVDIWLELGCPSYQTFYDHLATKYDWEIAEYARGHISKICDASERIDDVRGGMERFIQNQLLNLPRNKQAEKVFESYGRKSNRSAMVFHLLDGKGLTDDDKKKLILQLM